VILRPYQEESISSLADGIVAGRRKQVLCSPTGSGKTVMAATLIKRAQTKSRKAVFIVDRLSLVEQTSRVFWSADIPHGVEQGNNTHGRGELVQICSAQTLEARGHLPDASLYVWDECHTMRKFLVEKMKEVSAPVVGLSATPFTQGLGDIFGGVVNVTTTDTLINEGYLVPLRVYAAREIDMTGAKTVAGEWSDGEVARRATVIIGDIVKEWSEKTAQVFGGPQPTLVFTPDVAYGEELVRAFAAIGQDFRQVSYRSQEEERRRDIRDFENGGCMGLISCEALAKGFDAPNAMVLIDARPYKKAFAAHIQKLGRVMRPNPGKAFAMVLDHSGNYRGFFSKMEDFFAHGVEALSEGLYLDTPRKEEPIATDEILCSGCGAGIGPAVTTCPACGHAKVRRSKVETVAGELVELTKADMRLAGPRFKADPRMAWYGCCEIAYMRKKGNFTEAKAFAYAQYKSLFGHYPENAWQFDIRHNAATKELQNHITKNVIAYARRRANGRKR